MRIFKRTNNGDVNFKKKKINLLTKQEQKSYHNAKVCYIYKEKFKDKHAKDKTYGKVRDHCHYTGEYRDAVQSICNLRYNIPKEIPIVFHSVANYD